MHRLLTVLTVLALLAASTLVEVSEASARQGSPAVGEDEPPGTGTEAGLTSSDELLAAAVLSYGGQVIMETARLEQAADSLRTSHTELASIETSRAELEASVAALEAEANDRIVDAYMNPAESTLGYVFGAEDLNGTLARNSVLRALADRHLLALAEVESVRAELAALERDAEAVVSRIGQLSEEQFEATEELASARREQLEMEEALTDRIQTFVSQIDGLNSGEPELVALLNSVSLDPTGIVVGPVESFAPQSGVPDTSGTGLIMPAVGQLTSLFGPRWGRLHKGIDIAAPAGTGIFAAADGVVLRSDTSNGYGKNVILYHGDGFTTLYAHMRELSVVEGQLVAQGDQLGEMGSTGSATGPHLHLEIRFGAAAVDPRPFLP